MTGPDLPDVPDFPVTERLRDWLAAALGDRPVRPVRRLAGGYRNDNLLLAAPDGLQMVLRRYGHDNRCAVEAALARRLAGVVPVPEVIAADPDGTAAGEPVLLSRFVAGVPASTALRDVHGADASRPGAVVGATLAAIGGMAFDRPGFFDGGDLVPGPPGFEPTAGLPAFVQRCLDSADRSVLTAKERAAVVRLAEHLDGHLAAVRGSSRLVHADFNPKNLLVRRDAEDWTVAAVLDWEFAYSSTPLADVGNMLRFEDEYPPGYVAGFLAGFQAGGGELPATWREISRAADLFALADLVSRPPGNPYVARARDRIRRQLG